MKVVEPFKKRIKAKQKCNLPWLNDECKALMKEKDVSLKTFLKCGLSNDRLRFISLRNKTTL